MIKNIIISPFSRPLRSGKKNAKNYPYWKEVISILRSKGHKVFQIGVDGEEDLGTERFFKSLSLKDLKDLLNKADIWMSVDNFINHFGAMIEKKGIVIFGKSDPNIFGYKQNINVLKDRKYLRNDQFGIWESEEFDAEVFISPEEIVEILNSKF